MDLDNQSQGAETMRECPHHEGIEQTLADIRTDLRAIKQTQDAMMLHLIPQATRTNGISISAGNTQHGPQQSAPSADWSRLWVSILMLALVVVGGWLVSIGVSPASQPAQVSQPR